MLSRKYYQQFAELIAWRITYAEKIKEPEQRKIIKEIAHDMCELFKRDNSRFDRERFLRACSITDTQF